MVRKFKIAGGGKARKLRRATLSTIKLKDGKKLYMASLGGHGYHYPTKSKSQAKRQVKALRASELHHAKHGRKL